MGIAAYNRTSEALIRAIDEHQARQRQRESFERACNREEDVKAFVTRLEGLLTGEAKGMMRMTIDANLNTPGRRQERLQANAREARAIWLAAPSLQALEDYASALLLYVRWVSAPFKLPFPVPRGLV